MKASDPVTATVDACERYWRRTDVPRAAIRDMRAELEAHLREAVAEGRTIDAVVGTDPEAFAEEWAREFRPPAARVPGQRGPIVMALVAAAVVLLSILVVPVTSTSTSVSCCPREVVESSTTSGTGLLIVGLSAGAAALAAAGAWLLHRGRATVGVALLGIGAATAIATTLGLVVSGLLVAAAVWALARGGLGARGAAGWAVASLTFAVAGALVTLFAPLGTSSSVSGGPEGAVTMETARTSLVAEEGWSLVGLVAVPVAIAAVPVLLSKTRWARGARWTAGVLLLALVLVSLASIGFLFAPSAVAMLAAAVTPGREQKAPGDPVDLGAGV